MNIPYGDDKKDDAGKDIDWTFAVDLAERIDEEDDQSESQDQPSGRLRKGVDADAQFSGNLNEARTEHRAIGTNDSRIEADCQKDDIFLPSWPLMSELVMLRTLLWRYLR